MDVLLLCQFAIWTFLYHLWRFTTWMLRYLDSSHLWSFRHQDNSPPPWTFLILCLNVCNLLSGGETSIANHPSVLSKWPKVQNVQTANCLRWQRNVQVADWRSSETSCHQYHSCFITHHVHHDVVAAAEEIRCRHSALSWLIRDSGNGRISENTLCQHTYTQTHANYHFITNKTVVRERKPPPIPKQEALLSQRGRAMLRVCISSIQTVNVFGTSHVQQSSIASY